MQEVEVLDQILDALGDRAVASAGQLVAELRHRVIEDLREAVVGRDVSELLVGRALALRCLCRRLARGAAGALAGLVRLADGALQIGQAGLDRGIARAARRRLAGARPARYPRGRGAGGPLARSSLIRA